jgi:hypothetical protein
VTPIGSIPQSTPAPTEICALTARYVSVTDETAAAIGPQLTPCRQHLDFSIEIDLPSAYQRERYPALYDNPIGRPRLTRRLAGRWDEHMQPLWCVGDLVVDGRRFELRRRGEPVQTEPLAFELILS